MSSRCFSTRFAMLCYAMCVTRNGEREGGREGEGATNGRTIVTAMIHYNNPLSCYGCCCRMGSAVGGMSAAGAGAASVQLATAVRKYHVRISHSLKLKF